jgi:hypothetical protein
MRKGNTRLFSTIISTKVVGAGGYVTGLDGAADGTLIGRCDTAGAFILGPNASEWVPAFVPGVTIAAADVSADYGINVFDAAVCWSDSGYMQQVTMGNLWRKAPGLNWAKTPFPRQMVNGNSHHRMNGKMLAIDPANPAVALYGNHHGRYRTTDAWNTHTVIPNASVPLPLVAGNGPYHDIIIFDRSSPVTGSGATVRTTGIFWFVPGAGTYHSTDAGATWVFIGGPISAATGRVRLSDGLLILTGLNIQDDGPVSIWNGSAWIAGARADGGGAALLHTVEFDVSVPNLVHGIQDGGAYCNSLDGGRTWGGLVTLKTDNPATVDIPWQVQNISSRAIGDIRQHPVNRRLRISCGIGCWDMRTPPTTLTDEFTTPPIVTHGLSLGIENMVTGALFNALDGTTDVTMQDKQHMPFGPNEIGRKFTNSYGPQRGKIVRGIAADFAPEDSKFLAVTLAADIGDDCAYSEDGGKTWIGRPHLKALTGGNGAGQIVVINKDTWIRWQFVTQANDGAAWSNGQPGGGGDPAAYRIANLNASIRGKIAPYITRNARAENPTWTEIVIGSGNASLAQLNSNSIRISMFKDPWNPTEVYLYNPADVDFPNTADSIASRGLWRIKVNPDDVAVTRLLDTRIWSNTNKDAFHLKMRHGGKPRTLLICGGDNVLGAYRGVVTGDSLTLTPLGGTDNVGAGTKFNEVQSVSAGKGRWDSDEPCAYVLGSRGTVDAQDNGVDFSKFGVWESRDLWTAAPGEETWERIDQFPGNTLPSTTTPAEGAPYNDVIASMHKYRTLTFTTGGMGAVHRFERHRRRVR